MPETIRKISLLIITLLLSACLFACKKQEETFEPKDLANMSIEEIVDSLTLQEKAAQMLQPAIYRISEDMMKDKDYGSILSNIPLTDAPTWRTYIDNFQQAALSSKAGIPFIYGQDDVHGVNYCLGAVLFPQNIGMGAANDPDLMYRIGQVTADEAKICHMLCNFSPCIAQSADPRWGRTYESYGSDLNNITALATAYVRGMLESGLVACAKHYLADGNVTFGTGEDSDADRLIDRGDSRLNEEEIAELLKVYQALIDTGVQTIMVSHSALNGVKMHENKEYIMKLKNEMGFDGFIVSDWNSVQNTSGATYYDQIVNGINAGIDMLMEVDSFDTAIRIITEAVEKGDIAEERINDAVTRIIKVKKEAGIIDDPLFAKLKTFQSDVGSDEYHKLAEEAVEKSLVLIKNDNDLLPLQSGTKICIMGPAADNKPAQCGGWTLDWNTSPIEDIPGVTSIKEGFDQKAAEFGLTIVEDPLQADVIVLCVGEQAYAEWNGDSEYIDLLGPLGLEGNEEALAEAIKYQKPVLTLLTAGRHIFIDRYINDWDALVMCYLPGSEGQAIVNVLCGKVPFTGTLPSPWYDSNEAIAAGKPWLEQGYAYNSEDRAE